jgi:bifunctional non-homologous end joining protein LigD
VARKRTRGPAFTVDVPEPLPAERDGDHWWMEAAGRRLRLSNLDKVFWPKEGYTKGDLLAYYWNVRDLILPYLEDRPLTRKRMPDGIEGPYFYEKNAPSHTPDWMPRCQVESEDEGGGFNDFLVANDAADLLFVVNSGAIEFHPLHARCDSIDHPDYLFFDLDPMGRARFEDVLTVARHVHVALEHLGLPAYAKTSGATGVQIYVGVDPRPTHDAVRAFVGAIGHAVRGVDPDRVTMEYQVKKRGDRVFIDHNMNRRGANISAVYCVRPEPGATVSTPLSWEEVKAGEARPQDFTITNAHERFAAVGDLFDGMLTRPVDPAPAFEALGIELTDPRPRLDLESSDRATAARPPAPRSRSSGRRPAQAGSVKVGSAEAGSAEAGSAEAGSAGGTLEEYRRRRKFDVTPEPGPEVRPGNGDLFVIQKHDATRLHYDLRLERDGVLASWAVPRGLPLAPGEKRMAVRTEDHPIEYADFEGWIPEGEYGAGEVKIFDRGRYEAPEWKDDKVTFRLEGSRHRGEFHLVKTKTDWLVFLSKSSVDLQPPPPPPMLPMLAEGGHEPFDRPDWRFEPKLDGIRTLAYVGTEGTRLISRTGRDQTERYPELANLARFVNALQAVIDGEIVASDPDGRPSFERLQQRMNLHGPKDIEKARRKIPVVFFAFDLLWLDGRDLTPEPVEQRRELLEGIVTEVGPMHLTAVVEGRGKDLFDAAKDLGFEGVVAKRRGSPYIPGRRTKDWRKIKAVNYQDCLILGWTVGTGSREATFGALLLGAYRDGELIWIGQVGTGFDERALADLQQRLRELETPEPPIDDPALREIKGARWTRPEIVCEVEFLEMTRVGKLRAPAFKGLRPDKAPADCVLERPAKRAE